MNLQISSASYNQVKLMLQWAASEGWNPGLNDAGLFYQADPAGFFIGQLAGKPVAVISKVRYSAEFSFLGLYMVEPEFRGRGYGYQIWQHAENYAPETNCGLDGVIAQQVNYRKSGFKLAYRNIRYCYIHKAVLRTDENSQHLVAASNIALSELLLFDREFFPSQRSGFLVSWLLTNQALVYREGRVIRGYGVIRRCLSGYKIGPLFAKDPQIARILFAALANLTALGSVIYLDVPEVNPSALRLVEELAMQAVFETARMYSQGAPQIAIEQVYGVNSFELG